MRQQGGAIKRPISGTKQSKSARVIQWAIGISVLGSLMLIGGFIYGTYAAFGGDVSGTTPKLSPSAGGVQKPNTTQTSNLHLVALGDSLAHGLGDASGNGFVGDVSQHYRQQGYSVIQSNFGIDGLTSSGLLNEMKQPSVQSLLPSADVILVSIGGNDLNDAAGLPEIHTDRITAAKQQFGVNLTSILAEIRKLNPSAPILLVGLYNPYEDITASKSQTDAVIQSWDTLEDETTAKFSKAVVVQTFDLFQLYGNQFLYVDHFHPNQAGYQRIADRIWQDLQNG